MGSPDRIVLNGDVFVAAGSEQHKEWQKKNDKYQIALRKFNERKQAIRDEIDALNEARHNGEIEDKDFKKKIKALLNEQRSLSISKFEDVQKYEYVPGAEIDRMPKAKPSEQHKVLAPMPIPGVKDVAPAKPSRVNQQSTTHLIPWDKRLKFPGWEFKTFPGTALSIPPTVLYVSRKWKDDRLVIERREGKWVLRGRTKTPYRMTKRVDGEIVEVSWHDADDIGAATVVAIRDLEDSRKALLTTRSNGFQVKVNKKTFPFDHKLVKKIKMVLDRGQKYLLKVGEDLYAIRRGRPATVKAVTYGDSTPVYIPELQAYMRLIFQEEH